MSLYSLIAYLKYRRTAKGRHGTHSPFVYALVDEVLLAKGSNNPTGIFAPGKAGLSQKYVSLLNRIASYYRYSDVVLASEASGGKHDMVLWDTKENNLDKLLPLVMEDGMIVVPNIYNTEADTTLWNTLRQNGSVRMSIDLFGVGLLLFRKEFKERQHFVLKT